LAEKVPVTGCTQSARNHKSKLAYKFLAAETRKKYDGPMLTYCAVIRLVVRTRYYVRVRSGLGLYSFNPNSNLTLPPTLRLLMP